jgi:hypothetical protein
MRIFESFGREKSVGDVESSLYRYFQAYRRKSRRRKEANAYSRER